jgi:hypothetical protein
MQGLQTRIAVPAATAPAGGVIGTERMNSGLINTNTTPTSANLSASGNAQNIGGVTEKKSTLANGGKVAAPTPKPLYVVYFGTSGFNTFSAKVNAMGTGDWAGYLGDDLAISVSNPAGKSTGWELFDAIEINGYTTPDNTKMPGIFYVDVPWDDNDANDNCVTNNFYKAGQNLINASPLHSLKMEYDNSGGVQRDQYNRPIRTLSWYSNSWGDPALSQADCSYGGQTNIDADEATVEDPYGPNPFIGNMPAGILSFNWKAPSIVYNDLNLQSVFYWCMFGSKTFLNGFRGANNGGTDLHNYNLLCNAGTLVPYGGGVTNGKMIATDLRLFVNDPAYFSTSGNYTNLFKKYLDAGNQSLGCNYPQSVNSTHVLKMYYALAVSGYSTIVLDEKIKFQNPPPVASGTGTGGGTSPQTGGGHTIIKANQE